MLDQILGCLYGGAIGDALGAPFEGYMPNQIRGEIEEFTSYEGYPDGQFTDDTQMTLATLESIVNCEGIDLDDVGSKMASLWADRSIIAPGGSCTHAALAILRGTSVTESGAAVGSAGNGAAMRMGFLGFYPWEDDKGRKSTLTRISEITHRDPRSVAGAIVVAEAIRNPEGSPADWVSLIEEDCPDFAELITNIDNLSMAAIVEAGDSRASVDHGVTPFVIPTVLAALRSVRENPDSWIDAVRCAIKYGGDTDTVASIAGGVAGAKSGWKAIPENLVEQVVESDRIRNLAVRYYGLIQQRLT